MKSIVISSLITTSLAAACSRFDTKCYAKQNIIQRDVIVIGGGASGSYAAVNLQAQGKSVIVVEKNGRLGGQVNTYQDPATGTYIDYGVQAYLNNSVALNFFNLLGVPVQNFSFASTAKPLYADFQTGQVLTNFTPGPTFSAGYLAELAKYPYLNNGYRLPNPVPADLLIPWRDYIAKYNLTDVAYSLSSQLSGLGNPLDVLSLYVFNAANNALLIEAQGAALTTSAGNNQAIYDSALKILGSNVLLNSTVVAGQRDKTPSATSVRLVVNTPSGTKLIVASQLVLGIAPVASNLAPLGLDAKEQAPISQIVSNGYFVGLVTNTGLSQSYHFTDASATNLYNVPTIPVAFRLFPTKVPSIFYYWYGGSANQTQAQIESTVAAEIAALQKTTPNATVGAKPQFLEFASHSPYHPQAASAQAIQNGLYSDMYALQGYRNTWYIGAFFVLSTGQLWNDTAAMLPSIISAIPH